MAKPDQSVPLTLADGSKLDAMVSYAGFTPKVTSAALISADPYYEGVTTMPAHIIEVVQNVITLQTVASNAYDDAYASKWAFPESDKTKQYHIPLPVDLDPAKAAMAATMQSLADAAMDKLNDHVMKFKAGIDQPASIPVSHEVTDDPRHSLAQNLVAALSDKTRSV